MRRADKTMCVRDSTNGRRNFRTGRTMVQESEDAAAGDGLTGDVAAP
jgi:hypothetical protein